MVCGEDRMTTQIVRDNTGREIRPGDIVQGTDDDYEDRERVAA